MSPRYYGNNDQSEYYQDSGFNPYTGRLNGGQLVMQVLNQIAALKRKKTEEGWELEDRAAQQTARDLQTKKYNLDISAAEREAKDYVSPKAKAQYDFVTGRFGAIADEQRNLREIKARGEEDRKTAGAREKANNAAKKGTSDAIKKQYLAAKKSIEANYTTSLAELEKQFSAQVGALRKPTAKNETAGRTVTADGSPYLRALQGAHSSRKRMRAELDARKAQELAKLENDYADALSTSESSVDEGETLTDFHVNPKTGERIGWNGKAWVVAK